jgi:hypothetical protein
MTLCEHQATHTIRNAGTPAAIVPATDALAACMAITTMLGEHGIDGRDERGLLPAGTGSMAADLGSRTAGSWRPDLARRRGSPC